jgi:hypothetical protein
MLVFVSQKSFDPGEKKHLVGHRLFTGGRTWRFPADQTSVFARWFKVSRAVSEK